MKILTDKSTKSRENESLRQYASAYNQLRAENQQLKQKLDLMGKNSKSGADETAAPPKSPSLSTSSKSSSSSDPTGNADRSSPDGQEFEDETTSSSASGHACRYSRLLLSYMYLELS